MWTGCGAARDIEGAFGWWERLSDASHALHPASVPRPVQAKALCCLANAFFERSDLPDDTRQIDDLYRAARLADECASLGLIAPFVLYAAKRLEAFGLRRQADCRYRGVDTTRFERLEFLWEAWEAREAEFSAEQRTRDAKVSKAPTRYKCAAEGCGIEATRKAGLLKCMGECPADLKPSYCSKECQRAVRDPQPFF
jgi:hypothetical protein